MAPVGTLHTTTDQSGGKRARAIAALAGLELNIPAHEYGVTSKTPEYLAKFPPGKIPAFEDNDGFKLFEGVVIARYLAGLAPNHNLLGKDAKETALVDQWVHYIDSEISVQNGVLYRIFTHKLPYNKVVETYLRTEQQRGLEVLEKHLLTQTYLVGHRITLADVAAVTTLGTCFRFSLDAAWRASHPNVFRYFETVANHPKLKDIVGPFELCEKPMQYTPPPKEKKEEKPKAEPKKKEEKPKKEAAADEEEEEPLVPEEPKAKNPLDSLPKSNFNLEDWKRAYSNMDTRGDNGSIKWFYDKFDAEGFSIWRVDFKYNEELTQVFMSSNQIGGFFNRLEASRKYLFGSVGVLGTANNSIISGVLILRGLDYKPVVDVAPDWESYTFQKIDLNDEASKAFFEAALAWDLEIDGKKWADGKNFK